MGWLSDLFGSDVGSGEYTKKDAAKDTGSTVKEVTEAHHQAHTDSGVREGKDKGFFGEKSTVPTSPGYTWKDAHPDNVLKKR